MLDTEKNILTSNQLIWNEREQLYIKEKEIQYDLNKDRSRKTLFIQKEEFWNDFYLDEKYYITKDFSKYFVFPRLEEELFFANIEPQAFTSIEHFVKEIKDKKRVEIAGNENAGKTVVLKQLFKEMSKTMVAIFCTKETISSGNYKRVIKNAFQDIYGESEIVYNKFEQLPKEKKVLFIDNAHQIDKTLYVSFLREIDDLFEYIICTTKTVIELDVTERIKVDLDKSKFRRYRILPFYSDLRHQLVKNIVKIRIPNNEEEQDNITNRITDVLKSQRKIFSLDPCFIIQATDYYYKNIQEASQNDGNIFSKVFESNLVAFITPFIKKNINVDKVLILLDKLGYYIYKSKLYTVKQEAIMFVINEYNKKHGDEVNVHDFLHIVTEARLIIKSNKNDEYKFGNKNHLEYFIAREIVRKYNDENSNDDLIELLNFACFGLNSNIILFITYITDNINLFRLILDKTIEYTSDWEEFELESVNIPYLQQMTPVHIKAPTAKDKQEVAKNEIEKEKNECTTEDIIARDYFDYDEEDIDKFINQIMRALSLMVTISRSLPSFEHRMYKEDKEKIVKAIYQLPNKIFYHWAVVVDSEKNNLIKYLKERYEAVYDNDSVDEDSLLEFLRWESMSLLLELMNVAMTNSTKSNTEAHLKKYPYSQHLTYSLQHLMGLGKMDRVGDFIAEAKEISNRTKHGLLQTMERRIIKNYLINSRNIQIPQIQQLNDTYFQINNSSKYLKSKFPSNNKSYKSVLIKREKNKIKQ